MTDSLLDAVFEVVDFALYLSGTIDCTRQPSKPDNVDAPPGPKPLPRAAQRMPAKTEEGTREQTDQAASGSDRAS